MPDREKLKREILEYFRDINFYYNNPNMLDDLSRMLDELTEEQEVTAIQKPNVNPFYKRYECPCGQMLWGFNYCPECGRRIKYE